MNALNRRPRGGLLAIGLLLLYLWPLAAMAQAKGIVVRDDRDKRVYLMGTPLRVVSLVPSLTETVCELGACDRLVGVDNFSNWPATIQKLPRVGGLEDTQIEKIAELKPDLILAAVSSRAVKRLESLGFSVMALEPRDMEGLKRSVNLLAQVLDEPGAGQQLLSRLEKRIAAAANRVPADWRGSTVYFEISSAPHAASESSFVGELLAQLSLRNVVPRALGPFPQISPEFILRREPRLVMASAKELSTMAARPGFDALPALRAGFTCGFAPTAWDALLRPGPRLAEGAEAVAECLGKLRPPLAAPGANQAIRAIQVPPPPTAATATTTTTAAAATASAADSAEAKSGKARR